MRKLKCFLRLHNPLHCFRWSDIEEKDEREINLDWQGMWAYETRVIYSNPWVLFATIETRYKCADCGRKFWYARGDFETLKMYQTTQEWMKKEGLE